jgi:hypothetical protein
MKKMTLTQKTILILMLSTALCLCAIALALAPSGPPGFPPIAPAPTLSPVVTIAPVGPTPLKHRAAGAIVQCRQFVKDRLVSPSSANFSNEKAYKVNGEPPNYHAVTGIVESQNRMGVLLRSEYRCDAHYVPNDPGVWVLDYLNIED